MKKSLLFSILASVAMAGSAQVMVHGINPNANPGVTQLRKANPTNPKRASVESFVFGYGNEYDMCSIVGIDYEGIYRPLVMIPKDVATRYAGNYITAIKFYLGPVSAEQATAVVVDNPISTESFSRTTGNVTADDWNTITLDTPYEIKADEQAFFGFEVEALDYEYPVGTFMGGTGDDTNSILSYGKDGSWKVIPSLGNWFYGPCAVLAVIEGDHMPANDVAITDVQIRDVVPPGEEGRLVCSFKNMAFNDLDFFSFTYTVNGKTYTQELGGNSFASNDGASFALFLPAIDEVGEYDVTLTLTNPNGEPDSDPSNNTWQGSFEVAPTVPRTVLLENFTSAYSATCPEAHMRLHAAVDSRTDVIWVSHHSGLSYWYDDYNTDMHEDYLWLFNDGATYCPAMMLDRRWLDPDWGTKDPGPATFVWTDPKLTELIDFAVNQYTKTSVGVTATYDESTRELKADVTADLTSAPGKKDAFWNVFVVEDNVVGYQTGDEEYVHYGITRENLAGVWGEKVEWDGTKASKSFTYTLPGFINADNVRVVAFLANYNSANPNDCKVLNATQTKLSASSGVICVNGNAVTVTGGNGVISTSGAADVKVYGIDGSLRAVSNGGNVTVAPGIYVVKADGVVSKVVVK